MTIILDLDRPAALEVRNTLAKAARELVNDKRINGWSVEPELSYLRAALEQVHNALNGKAEP
jgi:hypothetical protein